jgi:hypothetical protein
VIAALFIAVWNMAVEQRAPELAPVATTSHGAGEPPL